jgi:glycine/D-amino acid oxidase-like deaminating enzyme
VLHDQSRTGDAGLSGVGEQRVGNAEGSSVEVSVGEDELRALAAQLERHRLDATLRSSTIDSTPDTLPVISAAGTLPGFYLATGFSGAGFGTAPAAGKLAADLITGNTPEIDPRPYSHQRFMDGRRLAPVGLFQTLQGSASGTSS